MHTKTTMPARVKMLGALLATLIGLAPAVGAETLEWGATKYFQYNIEKVVVTPTIGVLGSYDVKVIFSVTNPVTGRAWNIQADAPFQSPSANLSLDIAWDPGTDFTNTGSENPTLTSVTTTALGKAAGAPVQVRSLQSVPALPAPPVATPCSGASDCPGVATPEYRYWVKKTVRPLAFVAPVAKGRVAIEGRPVCNGVDPAYICPAPTGTAFVNIPVRSATANFTFATTAGSSVVADPRRLIVDIRKCQRCHDDQQHGDVVVPRLSLHGGNRNENLALCVTCHNPNQTDVPYRYLTSLPAEDPRISGPETPIDFKVLVHSIHSGGFRETPFVVVGFNSSVVDFSGVRFPSELRNCLNCHVEVDGKGTFELPLAKSVLGTTVKTNSTYLVAKGATRTISVNPADDVKISPTAATCSACHDKAEVRSHMIRTGGASFSTSQSAIGTTVVERCVNCHGPGKDRDVRRVHEIGGSGGID